MRCGLDFTTKEERFQRERQGGQTVCSQLPPPQQRLDDEDTEAVTLTMSGGSSIDFNKREECAGKIFFAWPVVVPFSRPVTAPAREYLDCASIKMTPLRRRTDRKKKQHLLMSSEISHNNAGRSDLRQTLSGGAGPVLPPPTPPPPRRLLLPLLLLLLSPCS